jgi:multiple antibiotic resistance protein
VNLLEFILLAPVSLFLIINPLSTVPAFLAITEGDSAAERIRTARLGCLVAGGILLFFATAGQYLFSVLGITLPALQIAGGILLFAIGFDMMRSTDSVSRLLPEENAIARKMNEVGISPLGIPLLCGPGSISTVIVLQTQAISIGHNVALMCSVPLVYLACYIILRISVYSSTWINPIFLRVLRRIMGLLFATIAVQFIVNGIENLPFILSD